MIRDRRKVLALLTLAAFLAVASGTPLAYADGPCSETIVTASDGEVGDTLGFDVAIHKDVAVAGAIGDDDNGLDSGAAYVYRYDGLDWVEEAKLLPSGGLSGDLFGYSVAVHDDVIVIGHWAAEHHLKSIGSAYVYRFENTQWVEEAVLMPSSGAAGDAFGFSVAVGADVVVVGTPGDGDRGLGAGCAYVFRYDGTSWLEDAKLLAPDGMASDGFGASVDIEDDLVVVGAPGSGSSGAAYVFREDGTQWSDEAKLQVSDEEDAKSFGVSVAVSGHVILVGDPNGAGNGHSGGAAYVFRFDGTAWTDEAKLVAADGDSGFFGYHVAVENDLAIVGDHWADQFLTGAAYVYRFDGTDWPQEAKLMPSEYSSYGQFGFGVGIDGGTIVVSATGDSLLGTDFGSISMLDCDFPLCHGDVNGDGVIDPLDSGFVLTRLGCYIDWGDPDCTAADTNIDGVVDPTDVGFVLARFGVCP